GAPRQVGVGDGRGDVGEDVVLLLGDTGPGGEDDVGGQFDDRLEVDVVLTGELGGQFLARLGDGLVDPGQVSGVVAAPLVALDADADRPQCDRAPRGALTPRDP